MLSSLQVSFEDPGFIADSVFQRLVYGFHPYGVPQSGTPETLSRITRDDLVAFHRRNFVPNNTILAIVGDVTAEEAFAGVTKVFGDWQKGEVPAEGSLAPPDPTRRIVIVNKPDAVQTEIRVGHLGIRRNHPDYMPLNLAMRILGGEGANRLHQVLRTERGLTYGAQAEMDTLRETRRDRGVDQYALGGDRRSAAADGRRVLAAAARAGRRARARRRQGVHDRQLPADDRDADAIATQVLNVLFYGLPVEQLQSFRERVNAVTADDVRARVAFLPAPRSAVDRAGRQRRGVHPPAPRLGFGTFEVVEMNNLDLTTPDFKRAGGAGGAGGAGRGVVPGAAARPQAVPAARAANYQQSSAINPQAGPEARALLEKVIAAKGGLDTLRGVKSITARTRAEMPEPPSGAARGGEAPVVVETTTYLEYPGRVRVETKAPDVSVVQVYDGTRAWVKDPAGVHDVPAQAVAEIRLGLRRDTIAALLAAYDGTLRARQLPDIKDEAGRLHRALELSAADLDPMVLYIDPETFRIARADVHRGAALASR